MNGRRWLGIGTATVCLLCLLAGCLRAPGARYYTLAALAPAPTGATTEATLGVGPVRVSRHLRQPAMIRRTSAFEVRHCEFDLWADPLEEDIPTVIADNLARLTGAGRVLRSPWPAAETPKRQISLAVEACELNPDGQAELRVRWEVRDPAGTLLDGATATLREPAEGDIGQLAAAVSRALLTLSRDLAAAVGR